VLVSQKKAFDRSMIRKPNNTAVQEDIMDPSTFRLAEIIHNERLAKAAQARQWAQHSASSSLRSRLRLALSKRLIMWGERLSIPAVPMKARV
jgi:hypothetical protein